jgi:hypothetical protein
MMSLQRAPSDAKFLCATLMTGLDAIAVAPTQPQSPT